MTQILGEPQQCMSECTALNSRNMAHLSMGRNMAHIMGIMLHHRSTVVIHWCMGHHRHPLAAIHMRIPMLLLQVQQ